MARRALCLTGDPGDTVCECTHRLKNLSSSRGPGVPSFLLATAHAAPLGAGRGAASTHTVRDGRWDVVEVVHGEDTEKTDLKAETAKQSGGDSCADVTGSQDPRVQGGVNRVNRTG